MTRPLLDRWAWPLVLALLLTPLFGLTLFRVAFYLLYRERFAEAGAAELLAAFGTGLRFDLSIALSLAGIPALAILVASPWGGRHWVLWPLYWGVTAAAIALFALQGVDLYYFDFAGRHVSFEVMNVATDWKPIVALVAEAYLAQALAILAAIAVLAALAFRGVRRLAARPRVAVPFWSQALQVLALTALIGVGVRGGLQAKPIAVGTAFSGTNLALGHLALNAAFTAKATLLQRRPRTLDFMPEDEALAATRRLLELDGPPEDPRYPLLRAFPERPVARSGGRLKNLVIIAIESFSAQMTGALGGTREVTANFDRLAREGLLFSRFYANGTRSVEGVAAILTGYPALPNSPVIGSVLEQHGVGSLARALGAHGYRSLFVHAAFRGSMWLDAFAARSGFGRFIAEEDFPDSASKSDGTWGIFDGYALERLHEEIAAGPKPVLAFLFTLGPHTPYRLPEERFRKFGPELPNADMLNAFAYTDYALGRFFELARASDYWQDTVFMITADHNMGKGDLNRREAMWIPLLILNPGDPDFPRGAVSTTLGSQADMAPTALELLGIEAVVPFAGRSLLAPGAPRFALHAWSNQVGWQEGDWFVVHDLERPIALYRPGDDPRLRHNLVRDRAAARAAAPAVAHLEGYLQTVNNLLLANRTAPPP